MPRRTTFLKELFLTVLPLVMVVLVIHFGTNVNAGAQYSADVSDLPVFEGFAVDEEMTTVFDSPEGRIVDIYMSGPEGRVQAALDFYASTLPELGWTRRGSVYERGEEQLALQPEGSTLKFSIRPKDK